MLKQRILSTLKFFDLQDMPLTLFELHKFLLGDVEVMKTHLHSNFEVESPGWVGGQEKFSIDEIFSCLQSEMPGQVEESSGYYFLPGRKQIVNNRLENYYYGLDRERRIRRFLDFLRHLPFVRGVAIGGSQTLGVQKRDSDIDLFIITSPNFMWLARTLVSFYFQILGLRRYGKKVRNRFCLNHYLARPRAVDRERNLYKAMEYLRLRPVIYPQNIAAFQKNNRAWLRLFFSHAEWNETYPQPQSRAQKIGEKILDNFFGRTWEWLLKILEKSRIRQDEFTFVLDDELSFHPHSQHRVLLSRFFRKKISKLTTPHQRAPRSCAGVKVPSRRLSVRGSALRNNAL